MLLTEHPFEKQYRWTCQRANCAWESEYIDYTFDNYHNPRPPFCPRCGRGGNQKADSLPASIIEELEARHKR
jgi:hypothetical protein